MEGVKLVTNTSTRGIPKAVFPDKKLYVMEPKLEHCSRDSPIQLQLIWDAKADPKDHRPQQAT